MNRDDIIHMARESELLTTTEKGYQIWMPDNLERFVALVAAAEREACAEICDRNAEAWSKIEELSDWRKGYLDGLDNCADAIRARGEK